MNGFENKNSKVIAVEPNVAVGQLLTDAIRAVGFSEVQCVASVQDLISLIEVEPVDWVVTSLLPKDQTNALQFLKICTMFPELRKVRISLLLEPSESYVLPQAFELGLFSWHEKRFKDDTLSLSLAELQEIYVAKNQSDLLTSAEYLRRYLKLHKQYQELLDFEKALMGQFPGAADVLINLAFPQFTLGYQEKARLTLLQSKLIDPSLSKKADQLERELFGEVPLSDPGDNKGNINILGLEKCVVIDPDETVHKTVRKILEEIGAYQVESFLDGKEAWKWFETNQEPTLVVHEWKIPKVSGPALLQRLRKKGMHKVPLVTLSSLIMPEDTPLLKEMGVANVIAKPFDEKNFIKTLVWTIQQDRFPTDLAVMERKMRQFLAEGNKAKAIELKGRFMETPTASQGRKKYVEAEFFFFEQDYKRARDSAIEALKWLGESIFVLNVLGKALMKLNHYAAAIRCFESAQLISPKNIERLCQIAEVNSELGNDEGAEKALNAAKEIDAESDQVKLAEVKQALTKGHVEIARDLMKDMDSFSNIIAFLNNKAITLARSDKTDEGITLYKKALGAIPQRRTDTLSIVYYNLALAYIRKKELEEGIKNLKSAIEYGSPKILQRANSLKARVDLSQKTGEPLQFKETITIFGNPGEEEEQNLMSPELAQEKALENADVQETSEAKKEYSDALIRSQTDEIAAHREVISSIEIKRGDMCCYSLFIATDEKRKEAAALLQSLPRFSLRKKI